MQVVPVRRAASLAALVIALFAMLVASASASDSGRYIVVLKDSVSHPGAVAAEQADEVDADVSLVYRSAIKGYAAILPREEVQALEEDPRVDYVTPDRQMEAASQTVPTGIERIGAGANSKFHIDGIDESRVNADVAVIDSGVDYTHPDLNAVARTNCVPAKEEELTSKVCVDNTGTDGFGHGTHVAGIVGALDNEIGVVGDAPGARIWSVRVLNNSGIGYESWIVAGVDWVTAHSSQIEVANMSLRCVCAMPALEKAISASVKTGVVYVVAAGNDFQKDVKDVSPAKNPDVITVSALADFDGLPGALASVNCAQNAGSFFDDNLAGFSNNGTGVEVAAPGVCILSTVPGEAYAYNSGTSMAAPYVSGAAAILASKSNPNSKADVESIRQTIVEAGNFAWTDWSKDGVKEPLLDVSNEAVFDIPQLPTVTTEAASGVGPTSAALNATVNPNGYKTNYQFEYGPTTSYGKKVPLWMKVAGSGSEGVEVSELVKGLRSGSEFHFRVVASNAAGSVTGADQTFSTQSIPAGTTVFSFGFGEYGFGEGRLSLPTAITTDVAGNVWVADTNGQRIVEFNSDGEYIQEIGSGAIYGELHYPGGVAIDSKGNVWVADTGASRLLEFSSEGKYIRQVGSEGTTNGKFSGPEGIAIDSEGHVWVADSGNGRIQEFSSSGSFVRQFSSGEVTYPISVAIDSKDDVWVADNGVNRVREFSPTGEYLGQIGGDYGEDPHGFAAMSGGLAIDAKDNLWVSDLVKGTLTEFDSSGEFIQEFGEGGLALSWGPSVAIDAEGFIWIVSYHDSDVQKWETSE